MATATALLCSLGCGGSGTTLNTAPLTEEQKRKIAEEDRRIEEDESPGNKTLKSKGGAKPR